MSILIWVFLFVALLYWLAYLSAGLRNLRGIPALKELPEPSPDALPLVSVVIPACNEGHTIGAALEHWRREEYPQLELLLINDRSTDDTGAVMERFAAQDSRARVLHIESLPEGWLGKVHALHHGVHSARGEWLLFTDADVQLTPGTLRRAVGHAVRGHWDHLAGIPDLEPRSLWLDTAVALFSRVPLLSMPIWQVEDPNSKRSAGIGAFNLVRRAAFERTPGFEWLRLEVADDVGLGLMLKRSGARQSLVHGRGSIRVTWYETFGQMLRGTEKVWLASIGNYNVGGLYVFALLWGLLEVSPFIALLLKPWFGVLLLLLSYGVNLLARQFHGWKPLLPALLWPLGSLMLVYSAVRAAWVAGRKGGLEWRGTLYPFSELRKGKRFKAF